MPSSNTIATAETTAAVDGDEEIDDTVMVESDPEYDDDTKLNIEWLTNLWQRRKTTLPKLYNFKYSSESSLDRTKWPTWSFRIPNALNSCVPEPTKFLLSSIEVYVLCPHTFFPHLANDFTLSCPSCGGGSDIHLNGWSNGARPIMTKSGIALLISRRYVHTNCPAASGGKSTSFSSIHPSVIASYPPLIRCEIPFRVMSKSIISLDFINEIRESRISASMSAIALQHKALIDTWYATAHKKFLLAIQRMKTHPLHRHSTTNVQKFPSLNDMKIRPVSAEQLSRIYEDDVRRNLPLVAGYTALLRGTVLKWDHTFWVAKLIVNADGRKHSTALFSIMNEVGEILGSYFCHNKSLQSLKTEISMLRDRITHDHHPVKVIYTDNPNADKRFIGEIFGSTILVRRDVYHAIQDYTKGCNTKSEFRCSFISEVSSAFFLTNDGDRERVFTRYETSGIYTREQMRQFPRSWWKRRVKRYVRPKGDLEEMLESIFHRYRDKRLYNDRMLDIHTKIIAHVQRGWYDDPVDPSIPLHFNIGSDECPVFITSRSTSQLENFHRCIRGTMDSCLSESMMHLVFMDFVFRWNINKAINIRKVPLLSVYDPQLLNDIWKLSEELEVPTSIRPPFVQSWKPVVPAWCDDNNGPEVEIHETFGVLRHQYANESFIVSQVFMEEVNRFEEREIEAVEGSDAPELSNFLFRPEWDLRLQSVTRRVSFIGNDAEKGLFYTMAPKFMTDTKFENIRANEMALEWNVDIQTAVLDDRDTITTSIDRGHRENMTFPLKDIGFKDAFHLRIYGKQLDDTITRSRAIGSVEQRRRFWSYRSLLNDTIESPSPATILQPVLPIQTNNNASFEGCAPQQVPRSSDHNRQIDFSDAIVEEVSPHPNRTPPVTCPECRSQRHRSDTRCRTGQFARYRRLNPSGLNRYHNGERVSVTLAAYREWTAFSQQQREAFISRIDSDYL